MKSWKTTFIGLFTAVGYAVLTKMQQGDISVRDMVLTVGIVTLSTVAKDYNISTKENE